MMEKAAAALPPPPPHTQQRPTQQKQKVKTAYPFNPDSYLGHRGPDELETVTGNRLWCEKKTRRRAPRA